MFSVEKSVYNKLTDYFFNSQIQPQRSRKSSGQISSDQSIILSSSFEIFEDSIDQPQFNIQINYCEEQQKQRKSNQQLMFTQYKSPFSDYVVVETQEARLLQENDWLDIIKKKDISSIPKFDMYRSLQQGIPYMIRKDVWLLMANVNGQKQKYQFNYQQQANKQNPKWDKIIFQDIERTFTQHQYFSKIQDDNFIDLENNGKTRLFKILRCYSHLDPELGYTQGMNYIAASLLILMYPTNDKESIEQEFCFMDGAYESNVFWIFVHIMQEKNWRLIFLDNMDKLKEMTDKLSNQIKEHLPKIHKHFIDLDVDLLGCFSQHFLTLLIYNAPINFAKRVLDLFLYDGENVIFAVIIQILKKLENNLLAHKEYDTLYPFLRNDLIKTVYENHRLLRKQQSQNENLPKFPVQLYDIETHYVQKFQKQQL